MSEPSLPVPENAETPTPARHEDAEAATDAETIFPTALPPEEPETDVPTELIYREEAAAVQSDAQSGVPLSQSSPEQRAAQRSGVLPRDAGHPSDRTLPQTARDIRMTAERGVQTPPAQSGARGEAPAQALPARTAPETPEQTELFFAPLAPQPGSETEPSPARPTERAAHETDAERLPEWAKELLSQSGVTDMTQSSSVFNGGADAARGMQQISWSMPVAQSPAGQPRLSEPADLSFREPPAPEETAYRQPISDAELQRTADRVYKLIEDRLRRELRRSGR